MPFAPRPVFMAHFYPWEAKIKAEKKSRRRPNPSQSQSPAAGEKGSLRLRPSRALSTSNPQRAVSMRMQKGLLCPGRAFSALRLHATLISKFSSSLAGQNHSARPKRLTLKSGILSQRFRHVVDPYSRHSSASFVLLAVFPQQPPEQPEQQKTPARPSPFRSSSRFSSRSSKSHRRRPRQHQASL